jgi:hypothetical protein
MLRAKSRFNLKRFRSGLGPDPDPDPPAALHWAAAIAADQIALAAIFTVSAKIVTLKKNEMMPWAETV